MNYSLSELEGLCRKAAKGVGFTWGEAEDAGQAVRILAASHLPAAKVFCQYLKAVESGQSTAATCPIRLGCQLVDGANPRALNCAFPLLLMPFVARLAAQQGKPLVLFGKGFEATAGPNLAISVAALDTPKSGLTLARAPAPAPADPNIIRTYRADVSQSDIAFLSHISHRTYAPETDARRRAGAGAGDAGNT